MADLDDLKKELDEANQRMAALTEQVVEQAELVMDMRGEIQESRATNMYKRDAEALREQLNLVLSVKCVHTQTAEHTHKKFDTLLEALPYIKAHGSGTQVSIVF